MFERTIAVLIAVLCLWTAVAVLNGHEPSATSTILDQVTIAVMFLLWGFIWSKEK